MSRPKRTTHGDYGYARKQRCYCEPCTIASRKYVKQLQVDHARGIKRRVDADLVRRHVNDLLEMGVHQHQISRAAGIAHTVLVNIMRGATCGWTDEPAKYVLRPTALALLGVSYEDAMEVRTLVPSIGIHRRIQALEYLGHAKSTIARELGVSESQVHLYLKRDRAYSDTIPMIHEVYVRMRKTAGTSNYARWQAYRNNWASPMCWDDETIDDPEAVPVGQVCVVSACSRSVYLHNLCKAHHTDVRERGGYKETRRYKQVVERLGKDIRDPKRLRAELADLKEMGLTPVEAAARLGSGPTYVEKIWSEV